MAEEKLIELDRVEQQVLMFGVAHRFRYGDPSRYYIMQELLNLLYNKPEIRDAVVKDLGKEEFEVIYRRAMRGLKKNAEVFMLSNYVDKLNEFKVKIKDEGGDVNKMAKKVFEDIADKCKKMSSHVYLNFDIDFLFFKAISKTKWKDVGVKTEQVLNPQDSKFLLDSDISNLMNRR